ncbi:MAG: glycosyltransferase [Vicinamibacteria bacterium]|nr:glycosyltransferase [Vicinamibacteria bacterium]
MSLGIAYGLAVGLLALLNIGLVARLAAFRRDFPTLREWEGPEPASWPKLSVIVPCRNEAAGVEKAMSSLLAQDYPNLEIVAVDDRSEDATGAILDALAVKDSRLTVLHLTDLPEGWLGKNNAAHRGAARASGEWLLFTDGDVVFERDALKRSVAFAEAHGLGHFVALPQFEAHGLLERAFVSTFTIALAIKLNPSQLCVPRTWAYVGVGAFGLVRREAYEKIGGHTRLAFEVADDLKLGLLLRRGGVAQGCLTSDGMVRVQWQHGLVATLRGLEKNAFSGCEWNTALAIAAIVGVAGAALLPYLPLLVPAPGWTLPLAFLAAALPVVLVAASARRLSGGSGIEGLLAPVGALTLGGVIAWSTLLALLRRGIVWRGTFYPLRELRRRCVREWGMSAKDAIGWTPPPRPRRRV